MSDFLLIDEGNGIYNIKIQMTVRIVDKAVNVLKTKYIAKKDFSHLKEAPEGFRMIIFEAAPDANKNSAGRLFKAFVDGGEKGITKREAMRRSGLDFSEITDCFKNLKDMGWVEAFVDKNNGVGRPKEIWVLREII